MTELPPELPRHFQPSAARRGLDWLFRTRPHLDLVVADWQGWNVPTHHELRGPWLLVTLGQPSQGPVPDIFALWFFAIFKETGDVFEMDGPGGPVGDDPIYEPLKEAAR